MTIRAQDAYPESRRANCPRCDSDKIAKLPANNPASKQQWFRCEDCDHMWSLSLEPLGF